MFTMKKAHQRQLNIIDLLYNNQGWHHFNDIAEAVDASVYSIRDDLATIGSTFQNYISLSENKQTVHADFRQDVNLETFRRYYLKETVSLQFLEALFFNPYLELEEIAEMILTSRSTVYRFIPELNEQLLKDFDLNLTTKPLKIVGDERKIRNFFTIFFNMRYHPFEWPFQDINETLIRHSVQLIADILELSISPSEHRQLTLMTAIGIVRNQKHNYLSHRYLTKDISTFVARIKPYFAASKDSQQLHSLLGKSLDSAMLYDVFYPVFLLATQDSPDIPTDTNTIVNHLISFSISIDLTLNQDNAKRLGLGINTIIHCDTLALIYQTPKPMRASQFSTIIKNKHPELFEKFISLFRKIAVSKNLHLSDNTLDQLIIYIFTHWDNMFEQLQNDTSPVSVIVISDISNDHAQLISKDLIHSFKDAIDVSTYDVGTYQEALSSSPTIIVSTFDIPPIPDTFIINADPFPDESIYAQIQQILNLIHKKASFK